MGHRSYKTRRSAGVGRARADTWSLAVNGVLSVTVISFKIIISSSEALPREREKEKLLYLLTSTASPSTRPEQSL